MPDKRYLWIVNNFLHDMATGTWAACVLVIWLVAGRMAGAPADAVAVLRDANVAVLRLAIAALVVIGATGGVRLGYWRRQASPHELRHKRRALLVKHAAFGLIYGVGTAWLFTLVR